MLIHTPKINSQRGVTLLELMIALVTISVITVAIFQLYITQHKNYMTQDDVSNIQQNARAALNELGKQIRMAGFGLPMGVKALAVANTNPDTITVTYRTNDCETYLATAMSQPSAQLECATDVSCFDAGQWVYIYEPDSASGEWLEITQVVTGSMRLQHSTTTLSRKYGANSLVLSMSQVKFYIDKTTDANHPSLMVQSMGQLPQVYAEDISDLQFRYRMKSGAIDDEPAIVDNVREVMISVTGRSFKPDPDNMNTPYRRRSFATSVFLRNVGI
jgi:prepilin-type N-terminal cleavage/methylation domain-containing protein